MKQIVYVPQLVKDGKWEGSVTLKPLSFDEVMQMQEETIGVDTSDTKGNIQFLRKLVKDSGERYLKVELKRKECGTEYKSFDDLQYGAESHQILKEIAFGLRRGFDVGNSEAPQEPK